MTSPFCVYIASVNTDRYSHFFIKNDDKTSKCYYLLDDCHWGTNTRLVRHVLRYQTFSNNNLHSQILDFIIISHSVFLSLSKPCITFKFKGGKSHLSIISTWPNFIIWYCRYPRCLNHVTFSAMCGTIGCKQNVASGNLFDNFIIISKPFSKKQRRVPGHCQKTQLW